MAAVAHGLDAPILYRRPNIASASRIIEELRSVKMGTLIPAGRDAPLKLADALQKGQHVAIQVDQYFTNGVDVTFFGRKTKANPTLARLLQMRWICRDSRASVGLALVLRPKKVTSTPLVKYWSTRMATC